MLFHQIRKTGNPMGHTAYPTLEQACYEWQRNSEGQEVVLADTNGKDLHVFTLEECREAASRFRIP